MLKVLLKKQLQEVFKGYFYDAKRNRKRSRGGVILWFVFFGVIMIGVLGGMFAYLSSALCGSLTAVGMGWLYFVLMSGLSILLGAFGSVFNTYSGLYLSKDNDLLLSMPIPVSSIIASRLLNVYLMGVLYSSVVILPAVAVYWIVTGVTALKVVCGILLMLQISLIVLILSCLLGWVVAKASLKLKRKSFVTVLISIVFIGAYYFFYYRAQSVIEDLIANAADYGTSIKNSAYGLYLFGREGEGDLGAAALFTACVLAALGLTWIVLKKTFMSIATSVGATGKVRYTEKAVKPRSQFRAMLSKELARFASSSGYMLNCGLGILLVPACGVFLLIKGADLTAVLGTVFGEMEGAAGVLLCALLCAVTSMIDMVVPSVSLEGKNLWIYRSLPVESRQVIRVKITMQLLLSVPPMLFAVICAAIVLKLPAALLLLVCAVPLVYTVFTALFGAFLGIKMPNLTWTNELMPIKQSASVAIAIFGGLIFAVAIAVCYLAFAWPIGLAAYLSIWLAGMLGLGFVLFRWLDTKGAERLEELRA